MADAKYKVQDGVDGDWYSWDGDLLHDLVGPLSGGVGQDIGTIRGGTTNSTLGTNGVANLRTLIRDNRLQQAAAFTDALTNNTDALTKVQGLLDELTFQTATA